MARAKGRKKLDKFKILGSKTGTRKANAIVDRVNELTRDVDGLLGGGTRYFILSLDGEPARFAIPAKLIESDLDV